MEHPANGVIYSRRDGCTTVQPYMKMHKYLLFYL